MAVPTRKREQLPLGSYVKISALDIKVGRNFRPSQTLYVSIDHSDYCRKKAQWKARSDQLFRWTFEPSVNLFPRRSLLVHVQNSSRPTLREKPTIPKIKISADAISESTMARTSRTLPMVYTHSVKLSSTESCDVQLTYELAYFSISEESTSNDDRLDQALADSRILVSYDNIFGGLQSMQSLLQNLGPSLQFIEGVAHIAQWASDVHPIAKAVVMALSVPFKLLQNEMVFDQDLRSLGREMYSLLSCFKELNSANAVTSDVLYEPIVAIMEIMLEAAQFATDYMKKNRIDRIVSSQFRDGLGGMIKEFERLGSQFNRALAAHTAAEQNRMKEKEVLHKSLNPPKRRVSSRCMEGTRRKVLTEIDEWIKDYDQPNILWIRSSPGAGKTAICSTVVLKYSRRCAWFFFKRDCEKLKDPLTLWPTIAFDLAESHECIRQNLMRTVHQHSKDADVESQFDILIKDPLISNKETLTADPPIIIIDALDEATSWKTLLGTLRNWSELPRQFKLIITSRDYIAIRKELHSVSKAIVLPAGDHDLLDTETSSDLRHFFKTHLKRVAHEQDLPSEWPGDAKIEELVRKAGGLFIWAETAVEFIGQGNSEERLVDLLSSGSLGGEDGSLIDRLYGQVLHYCFKDLTPREDKALRLVLAIIVLAKDRLSSDDLRAFLPSDVMPRLRAFMPNLSPVILLDREKQYRVCHASFTDFILDQDRSKSFAVDRINQSVALAQVFVEYMNKEDNVKFNKCQLETSHCLRNEIPQLSERMETAIPTSVRYASRFWAEHLADITEDVDCSGLLLVLKDFLYSHFLHWLEIMSFVDAVHSAPGLLSSAAQWIGERDKDLSDFVNDASRFVVTFQEPIAQSAPHIYLSALPFSPKQSKVAAHFRPQFPNTLHLITGRMEAWPRMSLVLRGHEAAVRSATFTMDGQRILTGSADGTLRIWGAVSGKALLEPLEAPSGEVLSVAVSPLSGKLCMAWLSADGVSRICHGLSAATMKVLPQRESMLRFDADFQSYAGSRIAFSSNGEWIASNYKGQLCVYNARNHNLLPASSEGHDDKVLCFAFVPGSQTLIASSCTDNTVRIWDVNTGTSVVKPFAVPKSKVYAMDFSPDGKRLVLASEKSISICNIYNEIDRIDIVDQAKGHTDFIWSVAFSPDGRYAASASEDTTIRVWDANTGKLSATPFVGHKKAVVCIAFFPDGRHLLSGSSDGTARIWDFDAGPETVKLSEEHSPEINSITFSRDNLRILSGCMDGTLCSWDAETSELIIGPLRVSEDPITSVAYSPDGTLIAFSGYGNAIHVWDIRIGQDFVKLLEHDMHCTSIECVTFFPSGDLLASSDNVGQVYIWDVKSGQQLRRLSIDRQGKAVRRSLRSVTISPDGTHVIAGGHDTIHIWDTSTGTLLTKPPRALPSLDPLYSDDEMEDSSSHSSYTGRDTNTKSEDSQNDYSDEDLDEDVDDYDPEEDLEDSDESDYHPRSHDFVYAVAVSPDGSHIVSGDRHTIRIWDGLTGAPIADLPPIKAHSARTRTVAFLPSEKPHFISGSSDKTIRFWSSNTGKSLREPMETNSQVWSIACSPNGKSFAAGLADGSICVWDTKVAQLQENSSSFFPVSFTPQGGRVVVPQEYPESSNEGRSEREVGHCNYAFVDGEGKPIFDDRCKLEDGWVLGPDGHARLFWVPPANRSGLWRPGNTAVMSRNVTRIDFSKFFHGESWTKCYISQS